MKKAPALLLTLVLALILAACGHTHEWQEATCTQPRTCTVGGETEGEPLGHDWLDATCTQPKTCARCGETEGEPLAHTWQEATCAQPQTCAVCGETQGEPLEHTWSEANYQDPAVCTVCGEVGEPLTPDFETYGIRANLEVGTGVFYTTVCYDSENFKTKGQLTVLDYNIFESDDTHKAKEDYEWRVATFQILFSDDNAWVHGTHIGFVYEDYYSVRQNANSGYGDNWNASFTVNYHGEDIECYHSLEFLTQEWQGRTFNVTIRVDFLVPVGYDGCVWGLYDYSNPYPDDAYIFDVYDPSSFRLFRFA